MRVMTMPFPAVPPDYATVMSRYCDYAVKTWYPARYSTSGIPTIAQTEAGLRGATMTAVALATALHLDFPLVDAASCRNYAARLIAAVARQHKANGSSGGWGGTWQSALWAAQCGEAAMLGWQKLIPNSVERNNVLTMLAYEADARLDNEPEFWRSPDGTELRPGDSAAEENSWNATVLVQAAAMMPDDIRADDWMRHALALCITAFSTRADCTSAVTQNGHPLSEWCAGGYNLRDDAMVVNHSRINPDYTATVYQSLHLPIVLAATGAPSPAGLVWGGYRAWRSLGLADVGGGTAYQRGTPLIHYPTGQPTSWGVRRPAVFLAADAHIRYMGLDMSGSAAYWEALHAADVAWMQSRPATDTHAANAVYDGKYTNPPEDSYSEREAWAGQHVAHAALAARYGSSVRYYSNEV